MVQRDNTAARARALWSAEGMSLEPPDFQTQFDAIYCAAEGIATYWHLGGAANDYLRAAPNSITVPPELALLLLSSRLVDGRIIGLKLLNRCSSDVAKISSEICKALESKHKGELYGGIFELTNLLGHIKSKASTNSAELLAKLSKLKSSRDLYVQESAVRLTNWLTDIPDD